MSELYDRMNPDKNEFLKRIENYSKITYGISAYSLSAKEAMLILDLKAKYQKAKRTLDFYATYSPFQFPEGYYEICIEKGVGGHNRFGTLARQTLAELGEKEEGDG